ncbi:hypothetical protein KDW_50900 [Dictyobacter vulcani]|uniref:histidine kinase n=1 Tax=Dictyobacter vulcani TaxID=2607529 RepID=A0A5J4KMI4_9CHLR|nr:PAS domain-containing sensor histidine kinase [Dictyobacter vulcani]GER90928.1 hypothetical protein KDW_50900 [Dictyobacter vulcani]
MGKDRSALTPEKKVLTPHPDKHKGMNISAPQQNQLQVYAELFAMSHDAIIICDSMYTILSWNNKAETIYGWTQEESKGQNYCELLKTHTLLASQDICTALQDTDYWQGEVVQISKNGPPLVMKSSQKILHNAEGKPTTILIVNQDITEQKQTEQKLREQLSLAAKANEIGLWSWDIINNNSLINNPIQAKLGNLPLGSTLNYRQFLHILRPEDRAAARKAIRHAIETGKEYSAEYQIFDTENVEHWVSLQGRVLYDGQGKPTNMVGIASDITDRRQKETRLYSSNQHLNLVLESIRDAFFHVDNHWNFTYINQQAEKIIQQSSASLLGKNIWEKLFSLKGTIFEEKAREAMQTQTNQHFEAFLEPLQLWFDVHLYPTPEGLAAYYYDVTAYKNTEMALHASEERFKRLIDANLIGFTLANLDGAIFEANDKLLMMLDYTREEMESGKLNWRDLTPTEYQNVDEQAVKDLQDTGLFMPVEKEYYNKQGKRIPVLMAGVTIDGNRSLCAAIIVDLTPQKELEKQKETFMSIVGHELRTPLTAINGSIQLAQRRIQRFLQERPEELPADVQIMIAKLQKLLEQSLRQTRVQNRLINDMLDASRLAIDKLELALQPDNLVHLVEETVADLRYTEGNHPIYLVLPEKRYIPVRADADRIGQVVANYISNALKYSNPEDPVTVEVTYTDTEARVWVHDRGQGLSEEVQKHIWDRYYRSSKTKDKKGTGVNLGLGLYICQILIKRHHGEVGVISKEGQGSSFWFSLPIDQTQNIHTNNQEAQHA